MMYERESTPQSSDGDEENEAIIRKPKYPWCVFFIVGNEFCERFNYYGMRTILALYLTRKLLYSDDTATILYHSSTTLVYFFCIIGAVIADSWWGKFKTIVWLSIVYAIGSIIITIGSIEPWHVPAKTLTFIGLGLIAIGSGGIKPCVAAFGGEQFRMPEQAKQLASFFSFFYFAINLGSLISTFVTPILREDVQCMGMDDCFPFGFGLPAILMAVSIFIFVAGKRAYTISPIQGNMLLKVCKCIGNAISTRRVQQTYEPKNHWLDYAAPKYGKKLVMETKILLNVLVLFIPLPIFWALFDQQGSRWTFQATHMDGDIGWFVIKPDQMQVINPFLILAFIPLYEFVFYPFLSLIGIQRPLQKMTLGGILAGVAFLCSMAIEMKIEPTYPALPKTGYSQLRMFNVLNCSVDVNLTISGATNTFKIGSNQFYQNLSVEVDGHAINFDYSIASFTPKCDINIKNHSTLNSGGADSFLISGEKDSPVKYIKDDPDKSIQGTPIVRILSNIDPKNRVKLSNNDGVQYDHSSNYMERTDIPDGLYKILVNDNVVLSDVRLKHGGVYAILIHENIIEDNKKYIVNVSIVTEPNSVKILWLVPQYVIMTLAEVMFSVTGLQFSYTEAPESMKSVIQGCWLLTVAFGNIIITIIVGAKFFESQTYEFLLFAVLMFLDMGLFMLLGIRYESIPLNEIAKADNEERYY